MVSSHADLFYNTGKQKGLLVSQPNQADFAARMRLTCGRVFWTGPESVNLLDYLFASGKVRALSPEF
eukprot:1396153-Lingulodinium_polyedra.AAC.1